jgi:quercetin dioxygenase-like cupin family protein
VAVRITVKVASNVVHLLGAEGQRVFISLFSLDFFGELRIGEALKLAFTY